MASRYEIHQFCFIYQIYINDRISYRKFTNFLFVSINKRVLLLDDTNQTSVAVVYEVYKCFESGPAVYVEYALRTRVVYESEGVVVSTV